MRQTSSEPVSTIHLRQNTLENGLLVLLIGLSRTKNWHLLFEQNWLNLGAAIKLSSMFM